MTREEFIRGIQLINSVLSENNQISADSTIDTYFLLLKDYNGKLYLNSIIELLKEEDLRFGPPSPSVIIKYIKKQSKDLNIKALDIFEQIKRDIVLFGHRIPPYKKEIMSIIDKVGGLNKIRYSDKNTLEKIEEDFVKEYSNYMEQKARVLSSNTKYIE